MESSFREKLNEILSGFTIGKIISKPEDKIKIVQHTTVSQAHKAIIDLVESIIPSVAEKQEGLCECQYLQCSHEAWNNCRQEILNKIKP